MPRTSSTEPRPAAGRSTDSAPPFIGVAAARSLMRHLAGLSVLAH
jgi:hypothetical protein